MRKPKLILCIVLCLILSYERVRDQRFYLPILSPYFALTLYEPYPEHTHD